MNSTFNGFLAAATILATISFGQILNAQITITGENTVEIGSTGTVVFSASGTDPVSGVTFVTAVNGNDGTGPAIVDVLGLGAFEGVTPVFGGDADPGSSPMAIVANFEQAGSQPIDATDFVALSFDTSGLAIGDEFFLSLAFGPQETTFTNDTNTTDSSVVTNFQSTFPVTVVAAVPEPSSLTLVLAAGGLTVLRRKRA